MQTSNKHHTQLVTFCRASVITLLVLFCHCKSENRKPELSPEETVLNAAQTGDWETLRQCLTADLSLAQTADARGRTLLHIAAQRTDDENILQFLIEQHCSITDKDNDGNTVLHYAAANPNLNSAILNCLISAGADVQVTNVRNEKPIAWTVRKNMNSTPLKCFIEHERFYNNGSRLVLDGASSLLFDAARWNGNPEIARILIENGADPNAEYQKKTPLHFAVAFNPNIAVAQCLVKLGANINTEPEIMFNGKARLTNTHLHYAARYNPNVEVSKWLVENGANLFQPPNHENLTPCEYAVMYNTNFDVVKFFVDLYLEEYTDDDTVMRLLCMAIENSPQKEVVDLLAKRVKNINACWQGRPPLHRAITHYAGEPNYQSKPVVSRQERFGFVDILIKNGADMNAVTSGGYTIYAVAESDDYDGSLTEFLKEYEARKR